MNADLLRKLMRQEFDMAKAEWERGELSERQAGYHIGAITAYCIVIQSQDAFDHADKLTTEINDLHFHPKHKEAA